MKLKRRVLAFSIAAITTSLLYGNCRFNHRRYEPQCDHIPGVCVYSRKTPYSAKLDTPMSLTSTNQRSRRINITYGKENISIEGRYYKGRSEPSQLLISGSHRYNCEYPLQITIDALGLPLVNCREEYQASLFNPITGIIDIIKTPEPVSIECIPTKQLGIATHERCRNYLDFETDQMGELCRVEHDLIDLSLEKEGVDRCRINNERADIIEFLDNVDGVDEETIREKTEHGQALIEEMGFRSEDTAVGGFSRIWDLLFGGGLLAGLLLFLRGIPRKKDTPKQSQKISPSPWYNSGAYPDESHHIYSKILNAKSPFDEVDYKKTNNPFSGPYAIAQKRFSREEKEAEDIKKGEEFLGELKSLYEKCNEMQDADGWFDIERRYALSLIKLKRYDMELFAHLEEERLHFSRFLDDSMPNEHKLQGIRQIFIKGKEAFSEKREDHLSKRKINEEDPLIHARISKLLGNGKESAPGITIAEENLAVPASLLGQKTKHESWEAVLGQRLLYQSPAAVYHDGNNIFNMWEIEKSQSADGLVALVETKLMSLTNLERKWKQYRIAWLIDGMVEHMGRRIMEKMYPDEAKLLDELDSEQELFHKLEKLVGREEMLSAILKDNDIGRIISGLERAGIPDDEIDEFLSGCHEMLCSFDKKEEELDALLDRMLERNKREDGGAEEVARMADLPGMSEEAIEAVKLLLPETQHDIAPRLAMDACMLHKLAGKGEIMDEERKKFEDEFDKLFERLEKAETLEECNEMLGEFESFEKRMKAEMPDLYAELEEDRRRFFNAWLGHVEMLGGPKAPLE
jgi:hypothetical protein